MGEEESEGSSFLFAKKKNNSYICEKFGRKMDRYNLKRYDIESCTLIWTHEFNLPVDIHVDTYCTYKLLNIPMCLFFRNGYDKQDEWIPITIDKSPKCLGKGKVGITKRDYFAVYHFVSLYRDELAALANRKINYLEFYEKVVNKRKKLTESRELLLEMSVITKDITGLDRDIWVDEGGTYKKGGHWIRIKVEVPSSRNDTHGWATLKIPSYEWVGGDDLSFKDKEKIVKYAKLNVEGLTNLTLGTIAMNDYLASSIKIGKDGVPINPKVEKEWKFFKSAGPNDIDIVKNSGIKTGFNYIKKGTSDPIFTYPDGTTALFINPNPFNNKGLTTNIDIYGNPFGLNINGKMWNIGE